MIRNLVSMFNKSIAKRAVSARYEYHVPVKVSIQPDAQTGKLLVLPPQVLSISGETSDLSKCGLAFIVPSIRIRENYLVGESRILNVELDLPNGKVAFKAIGQRYEQMLDEHTSVSRYLIGASIVEIADADREIYEYFLSYGKKLLNAVSTTSLKLGVDKS